MGFLGDVAGMLDFTGDWGSEKGDRYEKMTVRQRLILQVE